MTAPDHPHHIPKELAEAVNILFSIFELAYPSQFSAAFKGEHKLTAARQLWSQALRGFTTDAVTRAASQLATTETYLPSLALLIRTVEAITTGIEDPEQAFIEACRLVHTDAPEWSNPAIAAAVKEVGAWTLKNADANSVRPRFLSALARQMHLIAREHKAPDLLH